MEQSQSPTTFPNTAYRALKRRFKQEGFVHRYADRRAERAKNLSPARLSDQPSTIDTTAWNDNEFQADYIIGQVIGQGANAIVKKCIRRSDGELFAVKVSQVQEQHLLYLRKLFNRLSLLNHTNILHYREMYINMRKRTCHLVMDYITHPTLTDYIYRRIDNSEPLRETEIKEIMRQLFDVIRFLHSKRLCHRDVKPDNILFNRPQGKIWLIDFGVSKIMLERNVPKVMMTNTGTCEYKAPEIYEGGKYTESIDLWAAGVVLFEMVERQLPFSREYLSDVIQCIMDVDYECGEVWLELSKHAKDLLGRLLKPAAKRLTAEEALESLWFTEGDRNQKKTNQPNNRVGNRRLLLQVTSSVSLRTSPMHWNEPGQQLSKPPLSPLIVLRRPGNTSTEKPEQPAAQTLQPTAVVPKEKQPDRIANDLQLSASTKRFHLS